MSEYCFATEIAQKWGLSGRRVGLLCAQERIPGATKIGKTWMIPADAAKPADPRREQKSPENSLSSELARISKAVRVSVPRINPDRVMETASEERFRLIYEIAFTYARGDFERAICCYHELEGDDAAKLCACTIAIGAAISTGDYPLFIEIESYLKGIVGANISDDVTAYAQLALAGGYLGATAPNMVPDWLKDGDFTALPPEAKPDAAYKRVKYFQCIGQYESMLTAAQTALTFCDTEQEISLTCLYLRLMCAVALHTLGRIEEAKRWLQDAMRIYLPIGLITPFAELIVVLGGLVEQCLEKEFPAYYDAAIKQWERTIPNWIKFHNRFTQENIMLILSRRDYEMATLAAQGVPYAKIAKQFNVSVGRLNNIMREIYEKLFISGKKELAKFVLQPPKKT